MDERELVVRARAGDEDAFSALVQQHQQQIFSLCLRMTNNREDAFDLSQEAFLRAWRGLPQFQQSSRFSTWMFALTRNVCLDFLRTRRHDNTVPLTFEDENGEQTPLPVADPAPQPEELAEQKQSRQTVAECMALLPAEYREILQLRVVGELSYEQIADILNVRLGTVKSRLCRARLALRRALTERNFFDADASNASESEVTADEL